MDQSDRAWQYRRRVPLWALWTGTNAIAGALVGALESGGMQFLATLVLTGVIVGPAQWWVLRRWFPNPTAWLTVSVAGWLLGVLLQSELNSGLAPLIQFLWATAGAWEVLWLNVVNQPIILLVFSTMQGLVLRTRVRGAYGWVVASTMAGILKGAMGATTCLMVCQGLVRPPALAGAIAEGIGWASYGMITGIFLERWFREGNSRLLN